MSETRTRARALLAAATPGPWFRPEPNRDIGGVVQCRIDGDVRQVAAASGDAPMVGDGSPVELQRANAALVAAAPTLIATLCDEADAASAERAALRAVVCIDCGGTGGKRPNVGSTILYPPGTHCDKCGGSGAVIVKGDT